MFGQYSNKYAPNPAGKIKQGEPPRKPRRNIAELAAEFGVRIGQLQYAMREAPIPPPPDVFVSGKNRYFDYRAMQEWWKAIDGANFAVSERAEYNIAYRAKKKQADQSSMTEVAQ